MSGADERIRHRVVEAKPGMRLIRPFLEPSTAPFAGEVSPDTAAGADRYLLFETIAETLQEESQRVPLLSVLDDLQWADVATLRLTQHTLQHHGAGRLLTLATLRTVPPVANPELDEFLAALHRDRLVRRVRIGGLSIDEVADLVRSTGGETVDRRQVEGIHRATRGNAFFVSELAEHGQVSTPGNSTVPASVRDVLAVRIARLGADTVRLLGTAAVAGGDAPLTVLATASGLTGVALIDALDEAIQAGFLVEARDDEAAETDALAFRHGIVQHVVADRLSLTRRRAMHLALADAYAATGGRVSDLAHHLLEAGPLVDSGRTACAAIDAGRAALELFAYEGAVSWGERALAILDPADLTQRFRALLLLADAQRALGQREAAATTAASAAEVARAIGDPRLLAGAAEAVALARAGLGFDFGTENHGLADLLLEALATLPSDDVTTRSRLLEASLFNAAADGDLVRLHEVREEALALAAAHGHHVLVATANLAVRMSNWRVDTLDLRVETGRRALDAAERSGTPSLLLNVLLYLATDLMEAGAAEEFQRCSERVGELAARVRQPAYDAFVAFGEARDALLRGEFDRASELADHALAVGAQSHGVNAELAWAGQFFLRSWDQGHLAGMADLMLSAADKIPNTGAFRIAADLAVVAAGRTDEVAARLETHLHRNWLDMRRDSLWLASGGLVVELAHALGNRSVAAVALQALRPYADRMAVTGLGRAVLGPVSRFVGLAALTVGQLDEAVEQFTSAERLARSFDATTCEARSLAGHALALDERGRPGDAEAAAGLRRRADGLAGPIGLSLAPLMPA